MTRKDGFPGLDANYVFETGEIILKTKEAVEKGVEVTIQKPDLETIFSRQGGDSLP